MELVRRGVVIVSVLLCTVVVWTLADDDHGVHKCEKVLNQVPQLNLCSITISNCGPCFDGYVMDTPNVTVFIVDLARWPNVVNDSVVGFCTLPRRPHGHRASVGGSGNAMSYLKAAGWCDHLIPPPTAFQCLNCNLTIVIHTFRGHHGLNFHQATAFFNSTGYTVQLPLNDCSVEAGDADWSWTDENVWQISLGLFAPVTLYAVIMCICCRHRLCRSCTKERTAAPQPTSSSMALEQHALPMGGAPQSPGGVTSRQPSANGQPFTIFSLDSTAAAA